MKKRERVSSQDDSLWWKYQLVVMTKTMAIIIIIDDKNIKNGDSSLLGSDTVTRTFCSSTVIFKTTGNTHPATQHHIPEQLKLQKHHCKNLKPGGVHSLAEIQKQNILQTKLGQINVLCLPCTFFRIRCHGCQYVDNTHTVSYSTQWRIHRRKTDISCRLDTPAATTSSGRNLQHIYVQPT